MTAILPSYQQTWGTNGSQGGLKMNSDEVARMFMPRKSAQRANSSSSLSSNSSSSTSSSSTTTITTPQQPNGAIPTITDLSGWNTAAARKKNQRSGPWPANKTEPISGVTNARPQSVLTTNGASAASSMSSIHQPSSIVPSQQIPQNGTQQNGARPAAPVGEGNPVLYLLSMNGTFERKTITVPYFPDVLRIGRQTNAKTVPTPTNGYFDSKVLSRQHAEIWAERNGKIWIRDVRSSNGTFVNGARLSAENRDSEPHELQTSDHLELGIDIVSEDQKTVVHHKVATKVEHAGFLGATSNVMDMNFGDLDPANGVMMLPSQNGMQMRGRQSSQGSVNSNGRNGPPGSVQSGNVAMGPQRPMNFWLTPVTTEQIVKRLMHEMRAAKLQNSDLGRTEQFFGHLMSSDNLKESEKEIVPEVAQKQPQLNGSISFKDNKPRFTDPPAPPPQQPLPEKPDANRGNQLDSPSPSLKRANTEKAKAGSNISPVRANLEQNIQVSSLLEALNQAKKEIDSQNSRMAYLEEMLQREREARETAEIHAKQLEESAGSKMNGVAQEGGERNAMDEAFDLESETPAIPTDEENDDDGKEMMSVELVEAATTKLQEKLDSMIVEMREMRNHMEEYRQRAEIAESERDTDRKTLAEMVLKIRSEEETRRSISTERGRSPSKLNQVMNSLTAEGKHTQEEADEEITRAMQKTHPLGGTQNPLAVALSRPPGSQDHLLHHSGPYASMLGVILLGIGIMSYMNGWQKVER